MKSKLPVAKSGIHIDPKNKGKFNAIKKRTGKTTEELTHSKDPITKKRAIFAQNAKKWHHGNGGRVTYAKLGDQIQTSGTGYDWNTDNPNAPQAPNGYGVAPQDSVYNPPTPQMPQVIAAAPSTDNVPAPGNGPVTLKRATRPYWQAGYNPGMAAYSFDKAADARVNEQHTTDPNLQDQYHRQSVGNDIAGAGYTIAGIFNGVENTLGPISAAVATQRAKMNEQQAFNRNNRERAQVLPYKGDESQLGNGTRAAYENGGLVPSFEMGGIPTEGSDFGSQDPNVMTERGETITDPNRGPIGPNGQPTGVVVHDTTGDSHSDPSGGNAYRLGPDSVIHSKSLGVTVADFVRYAKDFPNADFIVGKIAEKFPNPDRKVSFAQLASVFDTTDLVKEVTKIAKKANNIDEKNLGQEDTHVTQKTNELNKHTLSKQDEETKHEIAVNADVTGPDGPIHNLAETLKKSGAYGEDVKNDDGSARFGKKVMNGKRLLLPKAGNGKVMNESVSTSTGLPVTLQERQTWNEFARYAHEDPNFGNADFYDKDTNYGLSKLNEFNQKNPNSTIKTAEDVGRVQAALLAIKNNPNSYGYPGQFANGKDLKVDNIIGTQTSSTLFPSVSETANGNTIDYGQDYEKYQQSQAKAKAQPDNTISMKRMGGKLPKAAGGKRIFVPSTDDKLPPTDAPTTDNTAYNAGTNEPQTQPVPQPEGFGMPIYNEGVYANTGYNNMPSDEYDQLYPNMKNDVSETGRQLVRSGEIIPSGDFTKVPTIYHQPLNQAGTYGAAMPWEKLASDPNSGREYYKTYAQDYRAQQLFGKDKTFADLTPQEQSQVTGWSPVQKTNGQWGVDPNYVKYHQSRYNQALQEEHPGYHYYEPNGDPNKNPWSIDAKSGEITTNEPWLVRKSFGPGKPFEYSKTEPVVYVTKPDGSKVPVPTKPVQGETPAPGGGMTIKRGPYQEGLDPRQIVSPLAALLEPREAVPYTEDQGAKDALAASTKQRFTDIQPGLNRITRGANAATRYNPQSNQAYEAQVAANAWTAENELQGQKFNSDNQIEQQYNEEQNRLRMAAGTNKAKALDTLAQRTATAKWKKTAMDINALGEIGHKSLENSAENKTAALYQDMFPNYAYDGSGTSFRGDGTFSVGPSKSDEVSRTTKKDEGAETTIIKYKDGTTHSITKPIQKFGGKLPKRQVKKSK